MIELESLREKEVSTTQGAIIVELYQDDAEYDWCARVRGGPEFLRGYYDLESLIEELPVELEWHLTQKAR